jgi:hypothetical protein
MFNPNYSIMKKISFVLVSIAIAISGFLSSCSDTTTTGFDTPSVDILYSAAGSSSVPLVDRDTVIKEEGTSLKFEVKFTMGDAGDKLTNVKVTSEISGKIYSVVDSSLDAGLFNGADKSLTLTYNTSVGSAIEKITFTTLDKQNREGTAIIYVKPKTVVPAGSVKTTEAIIMGSYSNATYGSCYSLSLNKVVTMSGGFSQQSSVDMLYYYGVTNKSTLAAPSNATLEQLYTSATNGIAKWGTRNNTKLLVKAVSNFDAITTSDLFNSAFPTSEISSASDIVNQLSVGTVFAMKTAGGKTALVKVTEINGTNSAGYIKITIKTVI